MLKALAAIIFLALTTGAASADTAVAPQADPYASPIEQCIRDNAAKVEASISDINQAVDFLVGKVCAVSIAEHNAEHTKLLQRQNFERIQKMCDEQTAAKAEAKADAGKPAGVDYCAIIKSATTMAVQPVPFDPWSTNIGVANANPAAAVALAAQLLLNIRAAHRHRES
jgi:hypothetical protein